MKADRNKRKDNLTTKEVILQSAKKVFLECGFQAAPLRRIVSEAGFTPGALYGYFNSKEELFYALTDPLAEKLMEVLEKVQKKMDSIPEEKRLYEMGTAYYESIPEIVDVLLDDRDAVRLIVNCSKGTRYERFLDEIAERNAVNINAAAESSEDSTTNSIENQTMDVLMDGYIRTLFRLILSDKKRETIIDCMEMIGEIYENGIIMIMKRGI